ncbi:hypothetical protein [Aidingimonas lacisalsi]|uniref:hypothetical protein n=1 Tax=Aidingimonas lacisalsi TaxID=2604086 RepID=UPI001F34E43C|nr:hypothetical protein [Aidingimonas lacisalsi]
MPHSLRPTDDEAPRSPLLNLLIVVTLVTVVVAAWYLVDYYLRGSSEHMTWYPPETPCDLHQGQCRAALGLHADMTLRIDGPIDTSRSLPLTVHLDGVDANAVTVEFVGRSMSMGANRVELEATDDGEFRGEGELGVCSETVMPWRAQVIVETDEGRKGSWFDFDITKEAG